MVRNEYQPLHKYLRDRYADSVVLTFSQIEDLLGTTLPDAARRIQAWWTDADVDGSPSPQSHTWIQAGRTALPNLSARTVRFERLSTRPA